MEQGSALTNAQSRFVSVDLDSILGPDCVLDCLYTELTHESSRGPFKGAVSAQKALQGSETEKRELLGGTEQKTVSPKRDHFAFQKNL